MGASNVIDVRLAIEGRPVDTILFCEAWGHGGWLSPGRERDHVSGHREDSARLPRAAERLSIALDLRSTTMTLDRHLFDAQGNVLAEFLLVGEYYGGLPRQTLLLPPSHQPAVSGTTPGAHRAWWARRGRHQVVQRRGQPVRTSLG